MSKAWPGHLVRALHARMPTLTVGDVWTDIPNDGDRIVIDDIYLDDDIPFPMVRYSRADGQVDLDPRMGAPMFLFGKLARRGAGYAWKPVRQ